MKSRLSAAFLATIVAAVTVRAAANAAVIGIYRNNMEADGLRGQIAKLDGDRCGRGGSSTAFRIVVGKATRQCSYRTPVIGRDLEISTVGRLLSNTPKAVARNAYLALNLRAGGNGARYQLAAFPLQRKAQLRKVLPDGQVKYLHVEKGVRLRGANRANDLRLRAFNITSGQDKGKCAVVAFVGNQRIAEVTDDAAGFLHGRAAGFSLGAVGNAKGAVGSFDDVVVRVPSPY
ncbi:MAG TPA: hypothetical protein VFC52_01120 [Solirubrobacterales bacterium]|nr:hypothetical protein [Solirubrobacterales bacterium]